MSWRLEAERTVTCSVSDFYSGVNVWLQRPNVVNRRLLGAVILYENKSPRHIHPVTDEPVTLDTVDMFNCPKGDIVSGCDTKNVFQSEQFQIKEQQIGPHVMPQLQCVLKMVASERGDKTVRNDRCIIREMLPKMRNMPASLEAVIIGKGYTRDWEIKAFHLQHQKNPISGNHIEQ